MRLLSLLLVSLLVLSLPIVAQDEVPPDVNVEYGYDSGWVANDTDHEQVIIGFPVSVDTARSLRLYFSEVELSGEPGNGTASVLRITSLEDGAQQRMNRIHAKQWQDSSAYFNGETVLVEVVAQPGTGLNRVKLSTVDVGVPFGTADSQCGATDDRVPSSDPRVGRLMPVVCTAWMIDDCNQCFLSAGHCVGTIDTMQFNVPLSSSSGSLNHPPPEDQYAVDPTSIQSNGGQGTGNDWSYFGTFPNSNTGLTAAQAMGSWFTLQNPPPVSGNSIRITGYGADDGMFDNIQQTHVGPFVSDSGTQLGYQTDTQGGNSGSPVIWEEGDVAIGIHTHGGCSSGQNSGTDIQLTSLQDAMNNPQGICASCGPPSISSVAPTSLATFPPGTVTILGDNFLGTSTVTVGSDVYTPSQFEVVNANRITLVPAAPAALGSAPIVVANSSGTSGPAAFEWIAADPPVLVVPPLEQSGTDMTWAYAGGAQDTAYLVISLSNTTFSFGGFNILAAPITLSNAALDDAGLGDLILPIPASAAGLMFWSQVITFDGAALQGASGALQTWIIV